MRLFITGASGYLGRRLARQGAKSHQVWAGCRSPEGISAGTPVVFDLLDPLTLSSSWQPPESDSWDAIIHCAAINPGGEESLMSRVNRDGSRAIARMAARFGARLVHISTDVVHNGRNPPYGDDDSPSPLNAYAASKAEAEEAVLDAYPSALCVRTSLIYGVDAMDRGTRGFADRLERGEPVRLFHDVVRHPVEVESLAAALLKLAELDHVTGRLNLAGSQTQTREQFGRKMLDFWQVPGRENVESIAAVDLSDKIPLDLTLDLSRAESLGLRLPGVDEVLAAARP